MNKLFFFLNFFHMNAYLKGFWLYYIICNTLFPNFPFYLASLGMNFIKSSYVENGWINP